MVPVRSQTRCFKIDFRSACLPPSIGSISSRMSLLQALKPVRKFDQFRKWSMFLIKMGTYTQYLYTCIYNIQPITALAMLAIKHTAQLDRDRRD